VVPIVATLGSHSALQILKGARDEGLGNLVIVPSGRETVYRRFPFIDEIIAVADYAAFPALEDDLLGRGAVIVPHGSFVAYLGRQTNERMRCGYYGNKAVLRWEGDRDLQRDWLVRSGVPVPAEYDDPQSVDAWPVMVKQHGAAGGSGYVLARNRASLERRIAELGEAPFAIQHYVIGVTLYIHYFQSVMRNRLEILSMDRRYETNVDALGRLPVGLQAELEPQPSYVVVGNSPLVLRESMLEAAFEMGERVVATSRAIIDARGMWGPFCLETVITPDMRFHVIEISCRIVAGTNLFVDGSPYAALLFDEPMSTGRRIARELREAAEAGRLDEIVDGQLAAPASSPPS
jgi:5-formaminoimidazole-4-carboxamide-1-(beta)-D-ribofuranosyl 5'-monophosphate synthetase